MTIDNVYVSHDNVLRLTYILETHNKGKSSDECITVQDLVDGLLDRAIQREYNKLRNGSIEND